jgi:hypothetical protein
MCLKNQAKSSKILSYRLKNNEGFPGFNLGKS